MKENWDSSGVLLFLDLDDFKQINDSKGHAFGDKVLRTVAEKIKSCVRSTDVVGRIGGDEFIVF
ncbi:GGDEF domain-containing protein, partial [Phocaeicola vulgatus]|uniref:GGDEF domain-containing protein n=2 Tax=Bacteria TaxID=2 RepID=UPI0021D41461